LLFQEFFSLFPFGQAASVAILPSALLVERSSLGARWVYWTQQVLHKIIDLTALSRREVGQDLVAVT
jgi:hypothetical protein